MTEKAMHLTGTADSHVSDGHLFLQIQTYL